MSPGPATQRFTYFTYLSLGYLNIVISNQPDIARGLMNINDLDKMTSLLLRQLLIDDVFYCVHDDSDQCNCRKPASGLFFDAAEKWGIDLHSSYMIGDTLKDIQAASKANVKSILLNRAYNLDCDHPIRIDNLKDIFKYIGS